MIRPQRFSFICGKASRIAWNGADRLTARASFIPMVRGESFDRTEVMNDSVVNQDVETAMLWLSALDEVGDLGRLTQAGTMVSHPSPRAADSGQSCFDDFG